MSNRTNDAPAGALLRLKAGASASVKRELVNLVNTTFLTSFSTRVNTITGEALSMPVVPPVSVGFIQYPDGGGELFGTRRVGKGKAELDNSQIDIPDFSLADAKLRNLVKPLTKEDKALRSREVASRRAKTQIRRICRFHSLKVMVTLTFPAEGIKEYNLALKYVQRFINDHGSCLHQGSAYVAVPELHPSGHGWHWHVLVNRRFTKEELETLRGKWTLFLSRKGLKPSGGAYFVRIHLKDFGDAIKSASYASKYVGKTFEDGGKEKYRKRYLYSRKNKVVIQRGNAWHLDQIREVASLIDGIYVFDSCGKDDWQAPETVWLTW